MDFLIQKNKFSAINYRILSISKGFTLIELLVVFSLIAVLSGIGLVSFVTYSRSQQVNQSANNIKLLINQARFNALSGVKTNQDINGNTVSCGAASLGGYTINILGNSQLEMNQLCTNISPSRIKLLVLPNNITFSVATTCTQIHFNTLSPTANGAPCSIVLSGFGQIKTISVDSGGNTSVR